MPQVTGGPAGLNSLLEQVYNECMKDKKNEGYCSRVAWTGAKNAGWYQNKKGEWKKKSVEEIKKDELAKKGGIRRKTQE